MSDDLVKRLRYGIVEHRKRWSGDTHADLGGSVDYDATTDMLHEAADRIAELEAELLETQDRANAFATKEYHTEMRAKQAEAKLSEQVEWVKSLADDLIEAEAREAWLKAVRNAAATAAYEDAAKVGVDYVNGDLAQPEMGIWWNIMQRAPADSTGALERVRREARNEALVEALQLIPNYHDDHWIESLRAPHFKRALAVLDRSIRAMMEDDDT